MSTSAAMPSNEAPVVCAGLVVADHVCPPLDHLPRAGELVAVDELVLNIGGGAANTAVDLSRLGVRAAICARVGDDIFGRFTTETLRDHQVDVTSLKTDPTLATSQTLIVNVRGQDRRFIHCVGANLGFVAADLDPVLERRPARLAHRVFLDPPATGCPRAGRTVRPGAQGGHADLARRRDARPGPLSRTAQSCAPTHRHLRPQRRRGRADPR